MSLQYAPLGIRQRALIWTNDAPKEASLVQVMARRQCGAKPLSKPMLTGPRVTNCIERLIKLFFLVEESVFEDVVCEIMAIVFRAECEISSRLASDIKFGSVLMSITQWLWL